MAASNLPPGCTTAMIERAFGGGDETCAAQSPDGSYHCNLPIDHGGEEHQARGETEEWTEEPACENPTCPNANPTWEYPCDHDVPPGTWVSSAMYGSGATYVKARWPIRPDDFNDDGEPTDRRRKVEAS